MYRFLALLLLTFPLENVRAQSTPSDADVLSAHPWFLTKVRTDKKLIDPPHSHRDARIEFKLSEDRVSGSDGCNGFFGKAQLRGSALLFSGLASTQMACPDDQLSPVFGRLLRDVNRYQLRDQQLHLCRNGRVLMTFKPESVKSPPNP